MKENKGTLSKTITISLSPRFEGEVYDIREFVNPRTYLVKKLANDLKAPNEELHVWNMFKFVVENIKYPWKAGVPEALMLFCDTHALFRHPFTPKLSICLLDFWKFPTETLRDGVGDCEDTTFLLASLLRVYKYKAYAVLGYVVIEGVLYGHAWVLYQHPSYDWIILETTLDSLEPYKDWEGYVEVEEQIKEIYRPEIMFNEEEVTVLRTSSLERIKNIVNKVTIV